mmetsp:Transcript_28227/g.67261  ORF Transcript_28227/g.67261 Transcript_28227/m.67261 type:complete len:239 (+) Transcript_28227:928-1644(+)
MQSTKSVSEAENSRIPLSRITLSASMDNTLPSLTRFFTVRSASTSLRLTIGALHTPGKAPSGSRRARNPNFSIAKKVSSTDVSSKKQRMNLPVFAKLFPFRYISSRTKYHTSLLMTHWIRLRSTPRDSSSTIASHPVFPAPSTTKFRCDPTAIAPGRAFTGAKPTRSCTGTRGSRADGTTTSEETATTLAHLTLVIFRSCETIVCQEHSPAAPRAHLYSARKKHVTRPLRRNRSIPRS